MPGVPLRDFTESVYEQERPFDLWLRYEEPSRKDRFGSRDGRTLWFLNPKYLPSSLNASKLQRRISNLKAIESGSIPTLPEWLDHFQGEEGQGQLKVLANEFRRLATLIQPKEPTKMGAPTKPSVDRVYQMKIVEEIPYKAIWLQLGVTDQGERDNLASAVRKRVQRARKKSVTKSKSLTSPSVAL